MSDEESDPGVNLNEDIPEEERPKRRKKHKKRKHVEKEEAPSENEEKSTFSFFDLFGFSKRNKSSYYRKDQAIKKITSLNKDYPLDVQKFFGESYNQFMQEYQNYNHQEAELIFERLKNSMNNAHPKDSVMPMIEPVGQMVEDMSQYYEGMKLKNFSKKVKEPDFKKKVYLFMLDKFDFMGGDTGAVLFTETSKIVGQSWLEAKADIVLPTLQAFTGQIPFVPIPTTTTQTDSNLP